MKRIYILVTKEKETFYTDILLSTKTVHLNLTTALKISKLHSFYCEPKIYKIQKLGFSKNFGEKPTR
jgi:hypothetical protein